jgi:hypothetical protein
MLFTSKENSSTSSRACGGQKIKLIRAILQTTHATWSSYNLPIMLAAELHTHFLAPYSRYIATLVATTCSRQEGLRLFLFLFCSSPAAGTVPGMSQRLVMHNSKQLPKSVPVPRFRRQRYLHVVVPSLEYPAETLDLMVEDDGTNYGCCYYRGR